MYSLLALFFVVGTVAVLPEVYGMTASCSQMCGRSWSPVCTYHDHTYPNECTARCRREYVKCDGVCPCKGKPEYSGPVYPYPPPFYPPPYYPGPSDYPGNPSYPDPPSYECRCGKDYDPVCSVSGESFDNRCLAHCEGQYVQCENKCPCT